MKFIKLDFNKTLLSLVIESQNVEMVKHLLQSPDIDLSLKFILH